MQDTYLSGKQNFEICTREQESIGLRQKLVATTRKPSKHGCMEANVSESKIFGDGMEKESERELQGKGVVRLKSVRVKTEGLGDSFRVRGVG